MSRRKIETQFCEKFGKGLAFSSEKDAKARAREIFLAGSGKLYVYPCTKEPCRQASVFHLTKALPNGARIVSINRSLVNFYHAEETKGDGRARQRMKNRYQRRRFARRNYRIMVLPQETWENEGGAILALHED